MNIKFFPLNILISCLLRVNVFEKNVLVFNDDYTTEKFMMTTENRFLCIESLSLIVICEQKTF